MQKSGVTKSKAGKNIHFKNSAIIIISLSSVIFLAIGVLLLSNVITVSGTSDMIIDSSEAAELSDVDCIIVLGAGLKSDGSPSDMLKDRLEVGVTLLEIGASDRLLLSGDHQNDDYDEVTAMKNYALSCGVSPRNIFLDHFGLSTYDSIYRAKEVYEAEKVIIVTQRYHLYRALHIAKKLGIEAYGVSADLHEYRGQFPRDIREVVARTKDYFYSIFKPEPDNMGGPVPLNGNGEVTHQKDQTG